MDTRHESWNREYTDLHGIHLDFDETVPPVVRTVRGRILEGPSGEGARMLDAGCGKGRIGLHFARDGFRVAGTDFSEPALRSFRREAVRLGIGGRVSVLCQDITSPWPFADGVFDIVVAVTILDNLVGDGDLRRVRDEIARVTRPGGHIVVQDYLPEDGYYGSLPHLQSGPGATVVRDVNNGLTFRLLSRGEMLELFGDGYTLIHDERCLFESEKYGRRYDRISSIMIFRLPL